MTIAEITALRKEVKEYIDHADDRILRAVRALLEAVEKDDKWADEISEDEMMAISRGLKQLDDKNGIPHEAAKKRLKWYPK